MPKGKNSDVRCVIPSIGVFHLIHPSVVERTWQPLTSYGGGPNQFGEVLNDIKGRIRLTVASDENIAALKDSSITVHEYSDITFFGETKISIIESVVASTVGSHMDLGEILKGKKPFSKETIDSITFSSSGEKLLENIKDSFRKKFLFGPFEYNTNSTYLAAFSVLIVDNLSLFREKMKGVTPPHPLLDANDSLAIFASHDTIDSFIPFLSGVHELPLLLIVLENKEVFDWMDNGKMPNDASEVYSDVISAREYFLYSFRLDLLNWQVSWLNSRCKNLLETLPKDEPKSTADRELRLKQLMDDTRKLEFYYSSYQIVRDFSIRDNLPRAIPRGFPRNLTTRKLQFAERLSVLEETLAKLEQSLERRMNLQKMAIDLDSRRQQKQTESSFKMVSVFLASFFVFEIFATFLSWYFQPSSVELDDLAIILWFCVTIVPLVIIYLVWRDFRKTIERKSAGAES